MMFNEKSLKRSFNINNKYNLINLNDYDILVVMQRLYGCNVGIPVKIVNGLTFEQETMCCDDYWIKVVD